MAWTTPVERSSEHKSWHTFLRGMCPHCDWHCDDCPAGVATCKCNFSKEALADQRMREELLGITDSWKD